MRAFILMVAAACLTVTLGCVNQNNTGELAEAPASAASRVNLYPLTSPPPGSVQPLQGYAPTRISASQYEYGAAAAADPAAIGLAGGGFGAAGMTYGNDPAFFDPNAAQVTYPDMSGTEAALYTGVTTTAPAMYPTTYPATTVATYRTQTAGFGVGAPFDATYAANVPNTTDPSSPYYCPPGAAYCPVPGSAPIANPAILPAAPATTFAAQPNAIYATAPAATTTATTYQTMATPSYQTAAYTTATPSYTTTVASYTPPVIPPAPVAAPVITAAPAPAPMRLSATAAYAPAPAPAPVPAYTPPPMPAYTPPAYTPPAYTPPPARPAPAFSASYQRDMPVGLHFGEIEGTADIVGPVPSLDPVVTPAPGVYSSGYRPVPMTTAPAPNYSAPYVQPLSMNTQIAPTPAAPVSENIYAMAAPAPSTVSAPVMTAAPAAPSRRPLLPSSVAGVSAQSADAGGYRLVPALDVPPGIHPNDYAPSQWFEVVRPGNTAVRIGRISATCVCVGARIPKRYYAAGERILVEARVLSKPSVNNVTYGLYVNILEPVETVVDADVTLRF